MCHAQFAILHHLSQIMWSQRIKYIIWGKEKQWKKQPPVPSYNITAVRLHLLENPTCANTYTDECFKIIGQAKSPYRLSVLEAMNINCSKPILCRNKEFVYHAKLFNNFLSWSFFHYIYFSIWLFRFFISLFVLLYHIPSIVISSFLPTYLNAFYKLLISACNQLTRRHEKHVSWILIKWTLFFTNEYRLKVYVSRIETIGTSQDL